MDNAQALELFGDLPPSQIRELFEKATPTRGDDLPQGLWLGRNGGMPRLGKLIARRLVRRDFFAKLILDGWGLNLRVAQDGSHALLHTRSGAVRVDLPFRTTPQGLDYGYHVAGLNLGPSSSALQIRDVLRSVDFGTLSDVVSLGHLHRVGASRSARPEDGTLVIGYILPAGLQALSAMPFGMVWQRDASPKELDSAQAYVRTVRLWDTCC